jgi:hypothetical protein
MVKITLQEAIYVQSHYQHQRLIVTRSGLVSQPLSSLVVDSFFLMFFGEFHRNTLRAGSQVERLLFVWLWMMIAVRHCWM